jgi:hypothetical protein
MAKRLTMEEFNTKIRLRWAYSIANKVRLGITQDDLDTFDDLMGDLTTDKTWLNDWELYADKEGKRTIEVIQRIEGLRINLEKLVSDICDDIPKSKWTDADRNMYDRKTGAHSKPTTPAKIEAKCNVAFTLIGGGQIKMGCKSNDDQKRPSRPKGANALELAYRIDIPATEAPASPGDGEVEVGGGSVKRKPLLNSDDGTTKITRQKASFIEEFGDENSGNYLQLFARWINNKHKGNEGPWTGPFGTVIP